MINDMMVTNNATFSNSSGWLHIILIWLSIFPTSIFFMFFFNLFSLWIHTIVIICFLPVSIILYYGIFILFLLLFSKLYLIILNLIHLPKEGIFERSLSNKDYLFFLLRRDLKRFTLKIYDYFPLPWAKLLALKALGIKVSYNSGVLDSYIDSDFIEIGNNVILGEGSVIMSSMIVRNFLIVKRVILKDRCTIGAFSVISPGTVVEEGAILGMGSYTQVNQRLEQNTIHIGRPAKRWKNIKNK
ncbi:MAG: DapH/DapD/GlmU-related protein [Candidatus Thorarchaeota archaeon]